jgi:menaquinone reductase, iron-sulfur cluster-binding subunit
MPRWGMVIDVDKCTACQACVVACKVENNIPSPTADDALKNRTISWMTLVPLRSETSENQKATFLPRPCMQCDQPPCIRVCPVDATNISEEGIVRQIYARCIGCRYCTNACPYTVRYFNWHPPEWPEEAQAYLNPDVSIRPKGVVEKCTFCHHRLQKAKEEARAEERELRPGDYIPACVEICPADAMFFGDLDDPGSQVSQLAKSPRAFRLLEELGTEPKVIYLKEGE